MGALDQNHLADEQLSSHARSDLNLTGKQQNTSSLQVHVASGKKNVSTHAAANLGTSEQDAQVGLDGLWTSQNASKKEVIAISGRTMTWTYLDGTAVTRSVQIKSVSCINLRSNHSVTQACLKDDGNLHWSDGEVWMRYEAQPAVDASALAQNHAAAEPQEVAQVDAHPVAKPEVVSLVQADHSHGATQKSIPLSDVSQKKTGGLFKPLKTGQMVTVGAVCVGVLLLCACVCAFADHSTSSKKRTRAGKRTPSIDSSSSRGSKGSGPREQHIHDGHVIYEWDQNDDVATVYVSVPPDITKHDMQIKISSKRLQVGKVGRPAFLKEETCEEIIEQDSTWKLRSNGELQIHLHKARKATWPCVFRHKREGD